MNCCLFDSDLIFLKKYNDHNKVFFWLQDRGELKVVTHGKKLSEFAIEHDTIRDMVRNSGLAPLMSCSYRIADKGLLSAFAERWHSETSSFHLPVGEMTITLDDVSCLLHIPIVGAFFSEPVMDRDIACTYLEELLGVTLDDARKETSATRGAHVRLSWLRDVYQMQCQQQHWDYAARAFLLHLVGCTIFADKSATYVDVAFLEAFRDLQTCGTYAWGAAALAFLYEHLRDASVHRTRQIGAYMTLLQVQKFKFNWL